MYFNNCIKENANMFWKTGFVFTRKNNLCLSSDFGLKNELERVFVKPTMSNFQCFGITERKPLREHPIHLPLL